VFIFHHLIEVKELYFNNNLAVGLQKKGSTATVNDQSSVMASLQYQIGLRYNQLTKHDKPVKSKKKKKRAEDSFSSGSASE
jgi:hypothetical protein